MTTTRPEYVALYEPAGTLAAALTGGERTAVLARRTETADGTPYYRPVMRGKIADVAMLVEQLAEVERLGRLGAMEPDPPEPQPIPLDPEQPEQDVKLGPSRRPHSRACGIAPHHHGDACSTNCPTCHGGVEPGEDVTA